MAELGKVLTKLVLRLSVGQHSDKKTEIKYWYISDRPPRAPHILVRRLSSPKTVRCLDWDILQGRKRPQRLQKLLKVLSSRYDVLTNSSLELSWIVCRNCQSRFFLIHSVIWRSWNVIRMKDEPWRLCWTSRNGVNQRSTTTLIS